MYLTADRTWGRKGVFIGCNYAGTNAQLYNCCNDARCFYKISNAHYGFPAISNDMKLLLDDNTTPIRPTRANIIEMMKWLVKDAKKGDKLLFTFSGHGNYVYQKFRDENDGFDEVICPEDYRTEGIITDNQMNEILVKNLPEGVRLTVVIDACHSGTVLDLPFKYIPRNPKYDINEENAFPVDPLIHKTSSGGDVILFSGCRDSEVSADSGIGNFPNGVLTAAMILTLFKTPHISCSDLIESVLEMIPRGLRQNPQLSSARPTDFSQTLFI